MTSTLSLPGGITRKPFDGEVITLDDGRDEIFILGSWWDLEAIRSGRTRIGGPGRWYRSLTWSPELWKLIRPRG